MTGKNNFYYEDEGRGRDSARIRRDDTRQAGYGYHTKDRRPTDGAGSHRIVFDSEYDGGYDPTDSPLTRPREDLIYEQEYVEDYTEDYESGYDTEAYSEDIAYTDTDVYDDPTPDPVPQMRRKQTRNNQQKMLKRRARARLIHRIHVAAACLLMIGAIGLVTYGAYKIYGSLGHRQERVSQENDTAAAAAEAAATEAEAAQVQEEEETPAEGIAFVEDENTLMMKPVFRNTEEESSEEAATEGTEDAEGEEETPQATSSEADSGEEPEGSSYSFDQKFIDASVADGFSGEGTDYVSSEYAILVDADTGKVLLDRSAYDRMNPASMTKVMTVLVAAEHLASQASLQDTVTITQDTVDKCYLSGLSSMYYMNGDVRTVEELFYGTILPSGADAAFALAIYTAGSEEAFIQMMNEKCQELGIGDTTHFTNPVGAYGEDHYSTAYDMAVIMKAAMDNEWCRTVLSAHTYNAGPSLAYPEEGHVVSNWFLRRIEDKYANGIVVGAKTGYVEQSGCCAVSYEESNDGTRYICCTASTWGSWRAIYDHVAIYNYFTK